MKPFIVLILFALTCPESLADEPTKADCKYQLDASAIEAVRNAALLWVEYERLPPPEIPLSASDEAKLAEAWAQFGIASRNVEKAWARALQDDPLWERALACLNRLVELEWKFNLLRNEIRREHGHDRFNELESQGSAWLQSDGKPWLDLDDTNLVRLYLHVEFAVHAKDKMRDGKVRPLTYEWMSTTEPYASEVSGADEELTEERALEICRAAISRQRKFTRDEHEKIATRLDLPRNMWQYLEIRNEAHYMEALGATYLGLNLSKLEDIRKVEAKYQVAAEQVVAIRPDAIIALHETHKEQLNKLVQEEVRQHEAFQSSLLRGGVRQ